MKKIFFLLIRSLLLWKWDSRLSFFIFDGAHEVPKEGLEKGLIWLNFIK